MFRRICPARRLNTSKACSFLSKIIELNLSIHCKQHLPLNLLFFADTFRTSPAPVSIRTNVSIEGGIKSVESPTHRIVVSNQGPVPGKLGWTKVTVELSRGQTTDMDRDFVLLVTPEEPHKPRLYLEVG